MSLSFQKSISKLMIAFLISLGACKKENTIEAEQPLSPTTGTRTEFTLDSIYLYAKQVYLWNDVIPSYTTFNPRRYTVSLTGITAFRTELLDISQLKNNPLTGIPYELPITAGAPRYSYLENGTGSGTTAAVVGTSQEAILKTAILSSGSIPVAYVALGSFPTLNSCKTALDNAFSTLSAANPHHIVIDLRTNGGGYVETAEYIANLIAPTSLNGKIIYTEQYNAMLQDGKATILKHQPYLDGNGKTVIYNGRNATMADVDYTESGNTYRFSKKGVMEGITDIYFIVSSRTASASELLISSLKPYFKVKLIGEKTYGKPVGFFPVQIDTYSVYLSSFLIRNSQGWSDYFNGMPADIAVAAEISPILGDPNEACVNAALSIISSGSTTGNTITSNSITLNSHAVLSNLKSGSNTALNITETTPQMIETRYHLKK